MNFEDLNIVESSIGLIEDVFNLSEEKLDFSDNDSDKQKVFRTLLIDRKVNTPRELSKKELGKLFSEYKLILSDPKRIKETLERGDLYEKVSKKEKVYSASKVHTALPDYEKEQKNKLDEEIFLNSF